MGSIQGQNFGLGIPELSPERQDRLYELLPEGARFVFPRKPDELHGDSAGAADHLATGNILPDGARHRQRINSGMRVEALVFKSDDRLLVFFGKRVGWRKAPLPVGSNACTEQPAIITFEHRRGGRVKKLAGQRKPKAHKPQQQNPCNHPLHALFHQNLLKLTTRSLSLPPPTSRVAGQR